MPADPIATFLIGVGIDPQALVMGLLGCAVFATGYWLVGLLVKADSK